MPSVKEKRSSFGPPRTEAGISMTPPTPTTPFRAELLTAARTAHPRSACVVPKLSPSSTIVCTRSTQGANVKGLIVSSSSIGISLSATATS
ncbi:hypothetical protein BFJ63_vAg20424 [Fusarium oxysporum f. sp. narcissi]|uniref:Uncharacterized protein n=1 Tax=Fusarium oxysporum f. sp. narcissi TaxID=451672 RepID=A0A4Q2UWE7_FUSOX|nr:hypothetical protein BFJ63_vAg20424 [Fusarium oxysporum f. sp. narcissi]